MKIARNYFKTYFIVDFITAVPLDLIVSRFHDSNVGAREAKLVKFVKMVRLFRLFRLLRIRRIIDSFEEISSVRHGLFSSVRYLLGIVLALHYISCAFIWLGLYTGQEADTWAEYKCYYLTTDIIDGVPVTACKSVIDATPRQQYVVALYWTATTMTSTGYGDVSAVNNAERILSILAMFFGAGLFVYATTQITVRSAHLFYYSFYVYYMKCSP